jgi:acyl-CoA thioesterase-1
MTTGRRSRLSLTMFALVLLSACSLRNVACNAPVGKPAEDQALSMEQPVNAPKTAKFEIAFLGDSLTAGYGLLTNQAYPALVQDLFEAEGYQEVETRNNGLSGDTTAGGLRRVEQVLAPDVHILVVALGGNDVLRGLSVTQTHDNIAAIIDAALARNVGVLVAGMQAPTNYGEDYAPAFRAAFERLGREYAGRITFVPFLLEGVAAVPTLNQEDGIHPNAEGQRKIAEMLYPLLRSMVDRAGSGRPE